MTLRVSIVSGWFGRPLGRLEKRGYSPTQTSGFLMRTLFTMFAKDIGLLPKDSFTDLLKRQKERPELLHHQLRGLCAMLGDKPLHVVAPTPSAWFAQDHDRGLAHVG
jgi:hypothetical protein